MLEPIFIPTRHLRGRWEVSRNNFEVEPLKREIPFDGLLWVAFSKCEIDLEVESKFKSLQRSLLDETAGTSHFRDILMSQYYRWMIRLSEPLIPILLREILLDPSPIWVSLLRDVAGLDPVPSEERSDYTKVVLRWRDWGLIEGYLRDERNSPSSAESWLGPLTSVN